MNKPYEDTYDRMRREFYAAVAQTERKDWGFSEARSAKRRHFLQRAEDRITLNVNADDYPQFRQALVQSRRTVGPSEVFRVRDTNWNTIMYGASTPPAPRLILWGNHSGPRPVRPGESPREHKPGNAALPQIRVGALVRNVPSNLIVSLEYVGDAPKGETVHDLGGGTFRPTLPGVPAARTQRVKASRGKKAYLRAKARRKS